MSKQLQQNYFHKHIFHQNFSKTKIYPQTSLKIIQLQDQQKIAQKETNQKSQHEFNIHSNLRRFTQIQKNDYLLSKQKNCQNSQYLQNQQEEKYFSFSKKQKIVFWFASLFTLATLIFSLTSEKSIFMDSIFYENQMSYSNKKKQRILTNQIYESKLLKSSIKDYQLLAQINQKSLKNNQDEHDQLDQQNKKNPTLNALDEVQFPSENQAYHIYPSVNSRLVLDMAKADDGYHDLILYEWQKSSNQQYYFKKVHENFYHIINAQTKEYMKKSQKIIQSTGVSKIKFQQGQDKLWQLVPANKNSENAFYILSPQKMALDLNQGYANNGGQLILYNWNKNDNQIWFLRKNQQFFNPKQANPQKYFEKCSQLLYKIMNSANSINECITLEEMKKQMKQKDIAIPSWLGTPPIPILTKSYYSQQISTKDLIRQAKPTTKINFNLKKTEKAPIFKPKKISLQCAKNHTVAYIWYGKKQMPQEYKQLLRICKNNTKLLTEDDYFFYMDTWNLQNPVYAVDSQNFTIRQRINLLKLLFLYYESGIYSDFDTQIHETCFSNVLADEIIFTNRMDQDVDYTVVFAISEIIVPEENFMMVRKRLNPQVKKMLKQEIMEHNQRGGRRWRECKYRQCLILQCQRHYRDNTYKKGYD